MTILAQLVHQGMPGLQDQIQTLYTLSALIAADFTLSEALTDCRDDTTHPHLRNALTRIIQQVEAGESLSTAMAMENCFPQVVSALIRSGETTGSLPETIDYAAKILELKNQGRQNLISALAYPTIIMIVTLLAAVFLATAIAPQIADMYHRMGADLPWLTRAVIRLGQMFLGILILLALIIPMVGASLRSASISKRLHALIRKLPLIRSVDQTHGTALWTRCLAILLEKGIQLPDALAITANGVASEFIGRELLAVRSAILSGQSPGDAFQSMTSCPNLAKRIISGGDRAGNLSAACARVFTILDTDYRNRMQRMLALAEPLAVLIAGCCVIIVALAIMLPVAELGGLIQ